MPRHPIALALVLLTTAWGLASSPGEVLAQALKHAKTLPPDQARRTRYLSSYYEPSWARRAVEYKVAAFWCNSLSRGPELVPPKLVAPGLLAVDTGSYEWDLAVWERFAKVEPYFGQYRPYEKIEKKWWPGGVWSNGYHYPAGWYDEKVKAVKRLPLPGTDPKVFDELYALTGSDVPVVRLDWFIVQTSVQEDRVAGYYDFLGLKKRADFEELTGLDKAAAIKRKNEIAAIIVDSGVAKNNRQIYRLGAIDRGYWVTYDAKEDVKDRNAARNLNGDFRHDFEEHYGFLANGLFAFYLSQADGTQANSAPDFIASDHTATKNDRRVHAGQCFRCHDKQGGLQPIDDWARTTYRGTVELGSTDYDKLKRLKQLYLSDLESKLKRDKADYAAVLKQVNGLTPPENARVYAALWERHAERKLTLSDVAREIGVPEKILVFALKIYALEAKAKGSGLDPVLAGFLQSPPVAARREHIEEIFALLLGVVEGARP